jgi:hypothetical protein
VSRALVEVAAYVRHVAALLLPGLSPGGFTAHQTEPDDISGWSADELRLLVEEGRRQLDRQRAELERVQTRAQFLFTTAVALLAVFVSQTDRIGGGAAVLWALGLAAVAWGMLGAAALMSVRAEFGGIDSTRLSHQQASEVLFSLARAYSSTVRVGENTVATRITVFRDAVLLVVVGATLHTCIWLLTV